MFGNNNLLLNVDSYITGHWAQLPPNTTNLFGYAEARGGEYTHTIVDGIELIVRMLEQGITVQDVEEANTLLLKHFGKQMFNYEGWMRVAAELGGKFPISIRAVKEGTRVPVKNALLTVQATHPDFAFVAAYFETLILRYIWYPTTVSTRSFEAKKVWYKYLTMTADEGVLEQVIGFKQHNFGSRSTTSTEADGIAGVAHAKHSLGTDTLNALVLAQQLYGEECIAYSVSARAHSTTTIYLREHEDDAYWNSINVAGDGIYSVVVDSYDQFGAVERLTSDAFKEAIIAKGGQCVLRLDSGEPIDSVMKAMRILEKNVGVTYNTKGYKVVHPSFRILQGDSIDVAEMNRILSWLETNKFAAENVVFGWGTKLNQDLNRDTCRFAFKTSAAIVDGQYRGVYKDPITDQGKKSKQGVLDLIINDRGEYETVSSEDFDFDFVHPQSQLIEVFRDGKILYHQSFKEAREMSDKYCKESIQ